MSAIVIILIVVVAVLWSRINGLEKAIGELKNSLRDLKSGASVPRREPVIEDAGEEEKPAILKPPPMILRRLESSDEVTKPTDEDRSIKDKIKTIGTELRNQLWVKIEKQFIENWTGIVGAVVMVMGVSFLGIYAALKLTPFLRFLMITLFAGALFSAHLFLRTRSIWLKVASWVRSSSGAILLFACLGAGGIEGLKWIHDPLFALGLLCAGIAVNLYFGFAGKTQIFASLHVILSLAAVGIAPQSMMTLIITGIVVLVGVLMTYRDRWEYHLLVTIAAFLVYQYIWYFSQHLGPATITMPQQIAGISVTAAIGFAACLVHYRKLYAVQRFEELPFIAHLMNWLFMGAGFLLYSSGSKWNTLVLACAAITAAILSRYARRLHIRWLFITDSLVSQSIALFAIYTLGRWNLDWLLIAAAMYVEIVLFLIVTIIEKETLLRKIGVILHCLSGFAVVITGMIKLDPHDVHSITGAAFILSVTVIIESILHIYSMRHLDDAIDLIHIQHGKRTFALSAGGIMIPLFILTIFSYVVQYPWAGIVITAVGVLVALGRQKLQSNGLAAGFVMLLIGVHIMAWMHTYEVLWGNYGGIAIYNLPLFIISLAGIFFAYIEDIKKSIVWPCIYAFTAHLIFFSYAISVTVSPYLPGVLCILLSAIYLQAAIYLKQRVGDTEATGEPYRFVFHAGCILILLFFVRHILIHMQPGPYIGFMKVRLIIELFALLVLLYWALAKLPEMERHDIVWKMHPLSWEVFLAFMVFTIALEVPSKWHPVMWALSGLIVFFVGVKCNDTLSRFRFYSILFFLASCLHTAFISSSEPTPSDLLMDQTWVTAIIAQGLQFISIIVYHRQNALVGIEFPLPSRLSSELIVKMQKRQSIWIYYPFFIALTLFLFWTFDKSILTLLWVAESFMMLILGIILKESHFRYVSMAALSGCLIRLVFFDLAQSGTITRAVVFLGVGLIMVLMNILYSKYRGRFDRS